jgi:cephalosporin hydroxylase
MKVTIDTDLGQVVVDDGSGPRSVPMDSAEGFRIASAAWLRVGWDTKYVYGFSWMGRPIIQLPDDMVRIQEVIYDIRPDVVVETGVAHGGSLIFYASLCKAMGSGRVIGIDIEIRPHNRSAIEAHELFDLITLYEGSSIDEDVVDAVRADVGGSRALVLLDSNHTRAHVLAELRAYADLVAPGSYLVATDGIMQDLVGAPRSGEAWATDNPQQAVRDFLAERDDFELVEPAFPFNEGVVEDRVTYWPNAFLRRRSGSAG